MSQPPQPSTQPPQRRSRRRRKPWYRQSEIMGPLIVASLLSVAAIVFNFPRIQHLIALDSNPTPIPTIPAATATTTAEAQSPTPPPMAIATVSPNASWLINPVDAHFGAEAPNGTITLTLNPGEILSLSTSVGTFMVRETNGSFVPTPLQRANGKAYVLIWEGNGSASETVKVTGVPSGNIDWERRHPTARTPWLPATIAVEKRVASGLMMSPNCGNGCTTVGYYILNADLQIVQTSE